MKTKLLILGGCACLLAAGCAYPQGGTSETSETVERESTTGTNEGVAPLPVAAPAAPTISGMNPRDMRDPQALTMPRPGVTLGPTRPNSQ